MPTKNMIKDLSLPFTLKHSVEKTIETYPNEWIVIHEALQNAIDAIQRSGKSEGHVKVFMDVENETVVVEDDGEGFPFDISLLGFGASNKDPSDYRISGEIGVGIKTVIASSKHFELWATYIDEKTGTLKKWHCVITDGYKFLKGLKDDIEINYDEPVEVSRESVTGTKIVYSFPEDEKRLLEFLKQIYDHYFSQVRIHDDLAESIEDKFKLAIEHYFRTTGYAANLNNLLGVNPTVPVEISISISCGPNSLKLLPEGLKEVFKNKKVITIKFRNTYWDVEEVIKRSKKPRPALIGYPMKTPFPGEGGYIGNYNINYIYVQKFTEWSDMQKLISNPKARPQPDPSYYKTYFEKYVTGIYLIIGGREVLRKYLLDFPRSRFIAASGVPSTHDIRTPTDVGGLGYINNICFIVNVKQKLTYGKQTIKNPWLLQKIYDFFRDAFRTTLIHTVQCISGKVPESPPILAIAPTNVVSRHDLNLSFSKIKKIPEEEVELIALFFELVGKGYIKDYEFWALSTREPYDGKALIHYEGIKINPPRSDKDLHNVEFKVRLSDLIDDFETGRKTSSNLHLIIVWEDDFDEKYPSGHVNYEVIPAESSTLLKEYHLEHVNKVLHDRSIGTEIPILEIKDVVKKIKNYEA
jgi:hypothetical protein